MTEGRLDDRYAINLGKTEIREGYRTGDIERILDQYTDGFGDMSDGFPSCGGADSKIIFGARLAAMFAQHCVTLVPVTIEILLFTTSETALEFGWHHFTFLPHTGEPAFTRRSRYLELWRKEPDGSWRIALFQDNEDQPDRMCEEILGALRAGTLNAATRNWT